MISKITESCTIGCLHTYSMVYWMMVVMMDFMDMKCRICQSNGLKLSTSSIVHEVKKRMHFKLLLKLRHTALSFNSLVLVERIGLKTCSKKPT